MPAGTLRFVAGTSRCLLPRRATAPSSTATSRGLSWPVKTPMVVASSGSLADLGRLEPDQLMAMYRKGRTPSLEDLDGKFSGRVLRMQSPRANHFLGRVLRSRFLPWHKIFAHETAGHGHGRLFLFKFETSIGHLRAGDFDAVHVEYSNPIMRWERDEVREVGPGLYLGLWYMHRRGDDHLVGFWGLARSHSAKSWKTPS